MLEQSIGELQSLSLKELCMHLSGLMEGCRDTAVGCVTLQPSFLCFPGYYLALPAPAGVRILG